MICTFVVTAKNGSRCLCGSLGAEDQGGGRALCSRHLAAAVTAIRWITAATRNDSYLFSRGTSTRDAMRAS